MLSQRQNVHRSRPALIAALLLATITFVGELGESHRDGLSSLAALLGDLPTFAAEHEQPDHTLHVEAATPAKPDSCFGCLGCLSQQRQLAVPTPAPVSGLFEPDASAIATESILRLAGDGRRLKPSRAPPLA